MRYGWIVFVVLFVGAVLTSFSFTKEPNWFLREEGSMCSVGIDRGGNSLSPLSGAFLGDIKQDPVRSDGAVTGKHVSAGSHHPVGVSYVEIAAEKPREFHPPGTLPKDIRLFNGKIFCETCHNVDSKGKFRLVTSSSESRLCLGCHIK